MHTTEQMTGHISVHQAYIDKFSEEEIKDAQEMLREHLASFYQMNDIGFKLRNNEIERQKKQLVSDGQYATTDLDTNEKQLIAADLQNDVDIKNAPVLNQQYQNTQNAGGL